jgi:hypothetical protein
VAGGWPALPPETAERELATAFSQQLVLIDEQPDGEVTGTVFGGYDGMRGWTAASPASTPPVATAAMSLSS